MRVLARLSVVAFTLVLALTALSLAPPGPATDEVAASPAVQTCALPAAAVPDLAILAHASLGTAALVQLAHVAPLAEVAGADRPDAVPSAQRLVFDTFATSPVSSTHGRWSLVEASTPETAPAVPDGVRLLTRLLNRQT